MIPRSDSLERLLAADDDERVSEAGRTILLTNGPRTRRAVLLLHGLTASPAQLRRYAGALAERGHNVLVPRFPRHGYRDRLTDALAGLTGDELRAFALDALEATRTLGDAVTVAGFSAGGTLALWLAQRDAFDRAVGIAPFLGAAAFPKPVMDLAVAAMLRLPNRFVWWDPVRRDRQLPEHGYPRYATHALGNLYDVARDVMQNANRVPRAHDVAVVLNRGEAAVNNAVIAATIRRWQAVGASIERVELRGMPPSHDIIEPDRNPALAERVFPTILAAIDPAA